MNDELQPAIDALEDSQNFLPQEYVITHDKISHALQTLRKMQETGVWVDAKAIENIGKKAHKLQQVADALRRKITRLTKEASDEGDGR